MSLVKHEIPNQKPVRAAYIRRVEDLSVEGQSDDLVMRRRLCNFMMTLFALCAGFAGIVVILHGTGLLMLPTIVLTTLIIVAFGAIPRMLGKIIKSAFHQE